MRVSHNRVITAYARATYGPGWLEQPIPLISPLNILTHEVQNEQRIVPFKRPELARSHANLHLLSVCPDEPCTSAVVRARRFEPVGCASVGTATGKPVRNFQ